MRIMTWIAVVGLLSFALACDKGKSDKQSEDVPAVEDLGRSEDIVVDSREQDVSPPEEVVPDVEVPDDTFQVGVAVGELFAPIGIPTAGYGQSPNAETPESPFTNAFVATMRIHTPILGKAIYLKRGEGEFILLRMDKIGTTPDFLDEFTRRLDDATGRSWDGKVVLASTHSHLGPGRLWENFVGEFANDQYWPVYYQRFMADTVNVALAAIADAEPGRFGYGNTECPECHNDRRCENPELLDSTLRVLRFDRTDGTPKAVVINFPIHGTVFGWKDSVLSGDAPGMMEYKLEERFDHPVPVMLVQSWGGDVTPAHPEVDSIEPVNPMIPSDYDRLESIGYAAADYIMAMFDGIETTDDTVFASNTIRPPIGYDLMGYEEGEWNYPLGGMMCGTTSDSLCWGEEGDPPNMACIPMPDGVAPTQFVLSSFYFNDLLFITIPGEPHTDFSLTTAEAAGAAAGFDNVAVIGYAQDHWGYIMHEYDWLLGGYEPTVSFWGPKQGDYMAAQIPHVAASLVDPEHELPFTALSPSLALPTGGDKSKYEPIPSESEAAIVQEPVATITAEGEALVTWIGGDPWLGTPTVTVQVQSGEEWTDFVLSQGRILTNRHFFLETSMLMEPPWKNDKQTQIRQFIWTARMPAKRNVPSTTSLTGGTYRFQIAGLALRDGATVEYALTSVPFALE
jgi:neutral ceramidase